MKDEFAKQLSAITGSKVVGANFYTPSPDSSDSRELSNPNYIRKIDDYTISPSTMERLEGKINFAEGNYKFYYKGKDATLVGTIKGNEIIDVKTFHSKNSNLSITDLVKERGNAYRLEKNGLGIFNLSPNADEGYDFLNFPAPTEKQLLSAKNLGYRFGTSSLEQMDSAFKDRSSLEALNYLGIELKAYNAEKMIEANGQITFKGTLSNSLASNKPIAPNLIYGGKAESTLLESNKAVSSTLLNSSSTGTLTNTTLKSNKSLIERWGGTISKVFRK